MYDREGGDRPPSGGSPAGSPDGPPWDRRHLLGLLGGAVAGALAGCGGNGDGTTQPTPSPTPTTARTTAAPTSTTGATQTSTSTQTETPTPSETTTTSTQPPTTVAYGRELVASPSSSVGPLDGFARTGWLAEQVPTIHRVTTLAGNGEGSLRAALEASGPRLVVFEVGGVVDLAGDGIEVSTDGLFVAGQTAPPPGITVIRGGIVIDAADVVIQHLRVRPGDDIPGPTDALSVGESGRNVIFDHCSATWGSDEVMSTGGSHDNHTVTFSNNIVAEGLSHSIHPKGEHSKGSLVMNNAKSVALVGNLLAHNRARNPRLKGGTTSVVVNNHVYHFSNAITMGGDSTEGPVSSVVGNRWERGPEKRIIEDAAEPENQSRVYVNDNAVVPLSAPMVGDGITVLEDRPVWPGDRLTPMPVDDVLAHTFQTVGARPADRTHHDQRIIDQVLEQTERYVDSQSDVGGYPDLDSTSRSLTVPAPGDGLAEWLYQHTRAVESEDASPP